MYAYKRQIGRLLDMYADERIAGCHRILISALKPTTRSCASRLSRVSRVSCTQQHAFERRRILIHCGHVAITCHVTGVSVVVAMWFGYRFVVEHVQYSEARAEACLDYSENTIGALRLLRQLPRLSMRVRISAGTCSSLRNISPQDRQTCDASNRKEVEVT